MAADDTSAQGDQNTTQFDCDIKVEDCGTWKKKVSISIPRSTIEAVEDGQFDEMTRTAEVPGFRKGRAPRRLVEKRFGDEISSQTKLRLLSQAFEKFDEEYDFDILGEPDLDIEELELPEDGAFEFDYEIEVRPEFELPALEGVRIEKPLYEVTTEQVDEALENLRRRLGRMEDVQGAAEPDDYIRGDVTLKIEGVDEPQTREDTLVRVGATALMGVAADGMGDALKGAEAGQTRTYSTTIADDHPDEQQRGKQAEFTIEVKGVRRMILPEMSEEFFANLGVDSEADLRQRLEEDLESQADRELRNLMSQQVMRYLDESVTFDLPEGVAARHAARVLQRQYYDLMRRGVPAEQINENIEELQARSTAESARQLKMSFVMEKVAEQLEVNVNEAEVNAFIAQTAAMYGRRPERVRDDMQRQGRLGELFGMIRDEKAVDKILEMAEVVDAPAASDNAAEAGDQ